MDWDRQNFQIAFDLLDRELGARVIRCSFYVLDAALLCVAVHANPSGSDVESCFASANEVRAAAASVAVELTLPNDGSRDAPRIFVQANNNFESWLSLPNLDVALADARTLLAMKCAAARTEEDASDIRFLADHLQLKSAQAVLEIALSFYPAERIPLRAQLLARGDCSRGPRSNV